MATAATTWSAVATRPTVKLGAREKTTIGWLVFFILIGFTLEAYWVIYNDQMEARHDIFARLLALYWPADRSYRVAGHSVAKSFPIALETVNAFVTQWFDILLIWAIVRGKRWRPTLQLIVATYTFYGTFLYYCVGHISGYAMFEYRGTYSFLMFYLANLPWFAGSAWLMYDAVRALHGPSPAAAAVPASAQAGK